MNVKSQNPQSVLGLTCHKTACEYCGKPRAVDAALKQCKGCAVTWYCNKQCQTAAWPYHKLICTSRSGAQVPPIYRNLGRATMAEISQASKDWAEVHKLSLFMIATVLVELRGGGVRAVLDAPQSVVFDLGPPRSYDGSPATAFTLVGMDINHQTNLGSVTAAQWSPPAVALRRTLARRFRAANAHPDIVGVLPVTFYVRDAQLAAQTNLPLHRPRPRPRVRAGGAFDERTKTALHSLVGICTGAINTGTVFRIPADASQIVPDVGRLVRRARGKGWTWTPPAGPLSQGRNVAMEFFGSREFEHAPVSALDSFTAYHRLWPYHSLRIDASRST